MSGAITRGSKKRIRVIFQDQTEAALDMTTSGYFGTMQTRVDDSTTVTVYRTDEANFTWTDQANGEGYFFWGKSETTSLFKDGEGVWADFFFWESATEDYHVGSLYMRAKDPKTVVLAAST